MTIFGERLRRLRMEKGVSIRYLAKSTGLHRSSIYRWEHGKAIPKSHEVISLVSNFFDVPVEYFFQPAPTIDIPTEIQKLREEINALRQLREEINALRKHSRSRVLS